MATTKQITVIEETARVAEAIYQEANGSTFVVKIPVSEYNKLSTQPEPSGVVFPKGKTGRFIAARLYSEFDTPAKKAVDGAIFVDKSKGDIYVFDKSDSTPPIKIEAKNVTVTITGKNVTGTLDHPDFTISNGQITTKDK